MSKYSDTNDVPYEEQMLTLKEVAAWFSTCEQTIKRWVEQVPEFPRPVPLPSYVREQWRFYRYQIVAFKRLLETTRVKRINKKRNVRKQDQVRHQ